MATICAGFFLLLGGLHIWEGIRTFLRGNHSGLNRKKYNKEIKYSDLNILGILGVLSGSIIFISSLSYMLGFDTILLNPIVILFLCVIPLKTLANVYYVIITRNKSDN